MTAVVLVGIWQNIQLNTDLIYPRFSKNPSVCWHADLVVIRSEN